MSYEKLPRTALDGEIWGDIPVLNFEYSVSTLGRVYSNRFRRYLSPWTNQYGYLEITIKGKHYLIHQLIANAHFGYVLGSGMEVNHIDGNKLNNALCNIEVTTHSENMKHAWRTGLIKPEVISRRCRGPLKYLGDTHKKLNDFVDGLSISRAEFERRTGVSRRIFYEGRSNKKLWDRTIEKIKSVYPQFEI